MNTIEITFAKNLKQLVTIYDKNYEFEFNVTDLAKSIDGNNSVNTLEEMSGLCFSDYTSFEMSMEVAHEWNHDDVKVLIQDFIKSEPENLVDYLLTA